MHTPLPAQAETYWGNVNTQGPRSCYDEGKRVAETMCYSYQRELNGEAVGGGGTIAWEGYRASRQPRIHSSDSQAR